MKLYSPGNRRPIPDAHGFTLLEVLIAFVIGILALSAMIAATGTALEASQVSARYQDATVRAQSRLAEATAGAALTPGEREGDDGGGYHWRVQVTPALTAPPEPNRPPLTLYAVDVWITWHDRTGTREIHLQSEQAVRPPARR